MTKKEFSEGFSAFTKKCRCGNFYKDYMENKFQCDACSRNQKIEKILNKDV